MIKGQWTVINRNDTCELKNFCIHFIASELVLFGEK